jgi:hypothetical protein
MLNYIAIKYVLRIAPLQLAVDVRHLENHAMIHFCNLFLLTGRDVHKLHIELQPHSSQLEMSKPVLLLITLSHPTLLLYSLCFLPVCCLLQESGVVAAHCPAFSHPPHLHRLLRLASTLPAEL